jgi:hypothetical protein
MSRTCSTYGEKMNVYMILVGKLEGRRPLETPRLKWVDNTKINLGERDGLDISGSGYSPAKSSCNHGN